jgi:isopenicillin-N epimerase
MTTRRDFLRRAALASAATLATPLPVFASHERPVPSGEMGATPLPAPPLGTPDEVAQDEAYWREVAQQYAVTDRVTNMEAGYFGMMAAPVLAAYHRNIDRVNRESSYFARRSYPEIASAARARVATALGVAPDELAFARNATEALQTLIGQYRL